MNTQSRPSRWPSLSFRASRRTLDASRPRRVAAWAVVCSAGGGFMFSSCVRTLGNASLQKRSAKSGTETTGAKINRLTTGSKGSPSHHSPIGIFGAAFCVGIPCSIDFSERPCWLLCVGGVTRMKPRRKLRCNRFRIATTRAKTCRLQTAFAKRSPQLSWG